MDPCLTYLSFFLMPRPLLFLLSYRSMQGRRIDKAAHSTFLVLVHFSQRSLSCSDNMTKRVLDRPYTIQHSWKAKTYIARASMLQSVSKFPLSLVFRKFLMTGQPKKKVKKEIKENMSFLSLASDLKDRILTKAGHSA